MLSREYDLWRKLGYQEKDILVKPNEDDVKYVEKHFKQHFQNNYEIKEIQLCTSNRQWNRYISW